jgi:hypothetical protein
MNRVAPGVVASWTMLLELLGAVNPTVLIFFLIILIVVITAALNVTMKLFARQTPTRRRDLIKLVEALRRHTPKN